LPSVRVRRILYGVVHMKTTAFSRSGSSNPHGKCTEELKTKVPEKVKEDFAVVSRLSDSLASAEYLRDVAMQHLYGAFPDDMKDIVWEHVLRETDSDLLRKLMYGLIFGQLHVRSVGDHISAIQAMNEPHLRAVERR
jgi:hypothetical protein